MTDDSLSAAPNRYQEALRLWLDWNEQHEQSTAAMFESRQDPQAVQELLDRLEKLRRRAVELSRQLLEGDD
jgi:hypothetical protein